jgi:hypothetical protein
VAAEPGIGRDRVGVDQYQKIVPRTGWFGYVARMAHLDSWPHQRWAGAALGVLAVALLPVACATTGEVDGAAGAAAGGGASPRSAPDDSDLFGVVPAGPETLIDLDMAQLRASPWSRALVDSVPAEERAAKAAARGFDDVDDVDRAVFAVSEGEAGPTTLMVARGRFDAARIDRATGGAWTARSWRGSRLWEQGGSAVALLTERTYLSGSAEAVREAIDCAWGLTPDVRRAELMDLEAALDIPHGHPALTALVTISQTMQRRIGGEIELPPGLQRVGVRLDLERALDLGLVASLATEREAQAAEHSLNATLADLRSRKALNVFGLAAIFRSAAVRAEGARVRGRLHLPEDQREDLAAKITFVLETIVRARTK